MSVGGEEYNIAMMRCTAALVDHHERRNKLVEGLLVCVACLAPGPMLG